MKREDRFLPFINGLLTDLIYCWQSKTTELLRIETAIMITRKHCEKIKHELFSHPFCSDEQEIDFFRNIQPNFTGRLCYYTILYEAHVSLPVKESEINYFWHNEQKRFYRFRDRNLAYIEYLESGNTNEDDKYFLMRMNRQPQPLHSRLYGLDPQFCTALDHLVSAHFAEKLYYYYVSAKNL